MAEGAPWNRLKARIVSRMKIANTTTGSLQKQGRLGGCDGFQSRHFFKGLHDEHKEVEVEATLAVMT